MSYCTTNGDEKSEGREIMVNYTEFLKRVYEMDSCSFVFASKYGVVRSGEVTPGTCRDNRDTIEVVFGDDSSFCFNKSEIESVSWERNAARISLSDGTSLVVENSDE